MKLFMATCTEHTDTIEVRLIGIFSSREAANASFDRVEVVKANSNTPPFFGNWNRKHSCFRGNHEVVEVQLDEWTPHGI